MKKTIVLAAVIVLAIVVTACDGFFASLDAVERAQAFVTDASQVPQDTSDLRSHFDPVNTADYGSMLAASYWDARFFNDLTAPFTLTGVSGPVADTLYEANGVRVSGTVTNDVAATRPADFHLVPDPNLTDNYLIRAIVLDPSGVNEEIIENRW